MVRIDDVGRGDQVDRRAGRHFGDLHFEAAVVTHHPDVGVVAEHDVLAVERAARGRGIIAIHLVAARAADQHVVILIAGDPVLAAEAVALRPDQVEGIEVGIGTVGKVELTVVAENHVAAFVAEEDIDAGIHAAEDDVVAELAFNVLVAAGAVGLVGRADQFLDAEVLRNRVIGEADFAVVAEDDIVVTGAIIRCTA